MTNKVMTGWTRPLLRRGFHAWSLALALTLAGAPSSAGADANGSGVRSTPAPASTARAPSKDYERAVELAFREFALGNYAEARTRFFEAHRLFPSARTHRALGMVEYELKNYGDAIAQLERALASRVKPLERPLRVETEELLARARGYVARLRVEVSPDQTTLLVDGMPVRLAPGSSLMLHVGDHNLEFRAPGRLSETRRIKIHGGEETTLRVVLAPAVDISARSSDERSLRRNPWLWSAVGVVVASVALGVGLAMRSPESSITEPEGGTSGVALAGPP